MRDQTKVFHLDPGESERSSGLLSNEYVIREEALVPGIRTYYDTFDWRLFRKKLTVEKVRFRDNTQVHVRRFDGQLVAETPLALEPGFAWDLPEGTLRDKLAPILQMRRLLPLAEMSFRGSRLNVLNADEKTVARVTMGQRKAWQPWENTPENVLPASLEVVPIRGYEKEYEHLLQFVESELPVEEVAESELATVLESVGRTPCYYSSKLNVQLEP